MKQHAIRRSVVGACLLLGLGVLAPSPAQADVPEEWGDPVVQFGLFGVTSHQLGRLPGRLGNQHVIVVSTFDEDSVVSGDVYDWWCPPGEVAPVNFMAETSCRLKETFIVDYDWPASIHHTWGPGLRWMSLRVPIVLRDAVTTDVVFHGKVSLRVKAAGGLTQVWHDGDYLDVLTRTQAHVVGGSFMGRQWLNMSKVEVLEDSLNLLRYYNPS